MSLVCRQYAKAFFDLAKQENALETYKDELTAVTDIYKSEKTFQNFILDPKISKNYKKNLIRVFQSNIGTNTLNFLMLLLDKNRIKYLPEIFEEFIKIFDKEKNILSITITSAIPLDQKYVDLVSEKYKKLYNSADVKVTLVNDKTLLGGIKVAIGDKLYDASLKESLRRLRSSMSM
ncbi:MAG: ATP synthase F1 subunit delta [Bacillota bacterium]|nr:ATP synthase F1 subunit delta [Bacillota bacterium]